MTRWCGTHKGDVPDHEAQIVHATETGSGPGLPVYACHDCIRTHGLLPLAAGGAALIGRRDAAPTLPPRGTHWWRRHVTQRELYRLLDRARLVQRGQGTARYPEAAWERLLNAVEQAGPEERGVNRDQ